MWCSFVSFFIWFSFGLDIPIRSNNILSQFCWALHGHFVIDVAFFCFSVLAASLTVVGWAWKIKYLSCLHQNVSGSFCGWRFTVNFGWVCFCWLLLSHSFLSPSPFPCLGTGIYIYNIIYIVLLNGIDMCSALLKPNYAVLFCNAVYRSVTFFCSYVWFYDEKQQTYSSHVNGTKVLKTGVFFFLGGCRIVVRVYRSSIRVQYIDQ